MGTKPSYEQLQDALQTAIEMLSGAGLGAAGGGSGPPDGAPAADEDWAGSGEGFESADSTSEVDWAERTMAVAQAVAATASAMAASLGQCRRDTPYSTLHPVISETGAFQWCCNHDTEHCVNG